MQVSLLLLPLKCLPQILHIVNLFVIHNIPYTTSQEDVKQCEIRFMEWIQLFFPAGGHIAQRTLTRETEMVNNATVLLNPCTLHCSAQKDIISFLI